MAMKTRKKLKLKLYDRKNGYENEVMEVISYE